MRARTFLGMIFVALGLAAGARAQTAEDLDEGIRLEAGAVEGEFTLKWWGKAGRTYFILTSETLFDWTYVPVIESGADEVIEWGFSTTASGFFVKLQFTDQTYTGPVADADFDGDKISNMAELLNNTNPLSNTDSDSDGLPDDWEIAMGTNPDDPYDMLLDADGDRIPNLYEYHHGTDAADPESYPPPHFLVSTTGSNTPSSPVKRTVNYAIQQASSSIHTIISVAAGSYPNVISCGKKVVILGAPDGSTVLSYDDQLTGVNVLSESVVLRDLQIVPAGWSQDRVPVIFTLPSGSAQAAMINCSVRHQGVPKYAPVQVQRGTLVMEHCTVAHNFTTLHSTTHTDFGMAGAVSLYSVTNYPVGDQRLVIRRCILWNPASHPSVEIFARSGSPVIAEDNIIRGGGFGGLDLDPMLDRYGCLSPGSPAIRTGSPVVGLTQGDLHGEPRDDLPDLGADEYADSDADGLPDWWETRYFGNLTAASGDSDNDVPEGDGLLNRYEYALGFDPLNPQSGGPGALPDHLAALLMEWDPHYPAEWKIDADGDGLNAGWEHYFGSSDASADSNGDGIPDGVAFRMGWHPMDDDVDGDGLTGAQELALGTNPLCADTDGDGVNDAEDAFPLDPFLWEFPAPDPMDTQAPQVVLTKPAEAVLLP